MGRAETRLIISWVLMSGWALLGYVHPAHPQSGAERVSKKWSATPKALSSEAGNIQKTEAMLSSVHGIEIGASQSMVHIVEFVDWQCKYCRRQAPAIEDTIQAMPWVRVTLLDLPLSKHLWAHEAAVDLLCVDIQNRSEFSRLSKGILEAQQILDKDSVFNEISTAVQNNKELNYLEWHRCISGRAVVRRIDAEGRLARRLNVTQTPTLFINGLRVDGVHSSIELKSMIEDARKRAT